MCGGDWRGAGVGSAMACAGQVDGGAQRLSRARREKERERERELGSE